jgi:hypothetical protein
MLPAGACAVGYGFGSPGCGRSEGMSREIAGVRRRRTVALSDIRVGGPVSSIRPTERRNPLDTGIEEEMNLTCGRPVQHLHRPRRCRTCLMSERTRRSRRFGWRANLL